MTRQIRFNAFEMNCVGHQSPSLWSRDIEAVKAEEAAARAKSSTRAPALA